MKEEKIITKEEFEQIKKIVYKGKAGFCYLTSRDEIKELIKVCDLFYKETLIEMIKKTPGLEITVHIKDNDDPFQVEVK